MHLSRVHDIPVMKPRMRDLWNLAGIFGGVVAFDPFRLCDAGKISRTAVTFLSGIITNAKRHTRRWSGQVRGRIGCGNEREQEAREKPEKDGPDCRRYRTGEAVIEVTRTDSNSRNIACRVGEGEGRAEETRRPEARLSRVTPQKHHTRLERRLLMRSMRRREKTARRLVAGSDKLTAAYSFGRLRDGEGAID